MDDFATILIDQTDRLFKESVTAACLSSADAGVFSTELWQLLEDAGLPSAMVPEEIGGSGLDAFVGARLIRLSAFHSLPAPLAETMIAKALWTGAGGSDVAGPVTVAPEAQLEIALAGDGLRVSGTLRRVPWAHSANHILTAGRVEDEEQLILVPREAYVVEPLRNLANEPRETVRLERALISTDNLRIFSKPGTGCESLLLAGAFVRAHQMAGAMRRCLELALAYANERKQFGKPIARFQAVQHMLADAAGQCAAAETSAALAAATWDTEYFALSVAVAKARCGEAAGKVAEICHQVHGAMGFTHEHVLHFYTRRLWAWRDEFGGEAVWQKMLGEQICRNGGEALWPLLVELRSAGVVREQAR